MLKVSCGIVPVSDCIGGDKCLLHSLLVYYIVELKGRHVNHSKQSSSYYRSLTSRLAFNTS
jgi:hypothetical protein